MIFCKDCNHIAQEGNATMCRATAISLIDGVERHSVDHCSKARGRNGRCGLEGRLFEPRIIPTVEVVEPEKARKPRASKKTQESTNDKAE